MVAGVEICRPVLDPLVLFPPNTFNICWLSSISALSLHDEDYYVPDEDYYVHDEDYYVHDEDYYVHDEDYSIDVSLTLISTFLLLSLGRYLC